MLRKLTPIAFVIVLLAVITGSVLPAEDMPHAGISDKLAHVVVYAVLALTGGVTFGSTRPFSILAAGLLLLGFGLEVAQAFIPGRSTSSYDMLANIIGIALGSIALIPINRIMDRRLRILE